MFILDCIFGTERASVQDVDSRPDWSKLDFTDRMKVVWKRRFDSGFEYSAVDTDNATIHHIETEEIRSTVGEFPFKRVLYAEDIAEKVKERDTIEAEIRNTYSLPLGTRAWLAFCRCVLPFETYIETVDSIQKKYNTEKKIESSGENRF